MIATFALALALAQQPAAPARPADAPLPEVLVDRRLAESLPLRPGDTVRVRALSGSGATRAFVVAGVFEREADPNRISRNEMELRFHLPDLLALLPQHDRVDRFALVLKRGTNADSAARWVEGVAFGTRAYGSAALA